MTLRARRPSYTVDRAVLRLLRANHVAYEGKSVIVNVAQSRRYGSPVALRYTSRDIQEAVVTEPQRSECKTLIMRVL